MTVPFSLPLLGPVLPFIILTLVLVLLYSSKVVQV